MANYPTGVYGPSAVANGQTIDAGRDNSQDAEITALENGLLNGLSHPLTLLSTNKLVVGGELSAGLSTVTSLQAGPSTITDLTVSSLHVLVPDVKLTHSADQAVASAAFTGLNWDTNAKDNASQHSTTTNSSRITFAHSTGMYAIGASIEWNANSSGTRILRLMLNDLTGIAATSAPALAGVTQMPQSVTGFVRVGSTADYATVQVHQNSGSTGSVTNSTFYGTTFWAFKVSS